MILFYPQKSNPVALLCCFIVLYACGNICKAQLSNDPVPMVRKQNSGTAANPTVEWNQKEALLEWIIIFAKDEKKEAKYKVLTKVKKHIQKGISQNEELRFYENSENGSFIRVITLPTNHPTGGRGGGPIPPKPPITPPVYNKVLIVDVMKFNRSIDDVLR